MLESATSYQRELRTCCVIQSDDAALNHEFGKLLPVHVAHRGRCGSILINKRCLLTLTRHYRARYRALLGTDSVNVHLAE